jgi:hypothetical protein
VLEESFGESYFGSEARLLALRCPVLRPESASDPLSIEEEEEPEAEAEEEEVLEDASELGEDEDDMAEVIENVDGKEKEP